MARVLDVQDSSTAAAGATTAAEFPMTAAAGAATAAEFPMTGTVSIFDPAMCCETGLCGPGVDPELLRIARDLRWLAAQGVTVERRGLSQEPQAFVANARVQGLMQAFGDGALPAVLVDGTVVTYGRYPTRDELVAVLTPAPAATDAPDASVSCCAPGSSCC